MSTFWTADLHLGHERVVTWRPQFNSLAHMHAEIIARWNTVVGHNDVVWILGDVVMGQREFTLPLVEKLNGEKRLIPGNHDYCHPSAWEYGGKRSEEQRQAKLNYWTERYEDVGLEVCATQLHATYRLGPVVMCHFPVSGDHSTETRFPEYRPMLPDRWWLLHGHVHGSMGQLHDGRQIDVGVDAWNFTPISEDQLVNLTDERTSA